MKKLRVSVIHPPSPPGRNIARDYAGGYGTAIHSNRDRYGTDQGYMPVPYVSLLYIAAILEDHNAEVQFIDGQAEDLSLEALSARILEFKPNLVVGVVSLPSIVQDLVLYKQLRDFSDDALFCAVGTACKGVTADVLQGNVFDVAICGDPELIVADIYDALSAGSDWREVEGIRYLVEGEMVSSAIVPRLTSLDAISVPAYHLAPMHKYVHNIFGDQKRYALVLSTKGCNGKCSFYCPYSFGYGRRIVYRSPEAVVGEIEMLVKQYGVSDIIFRDSTFTISREHAESVCDLMIKRNLEVDWLCETRFDCIDRGLLLKMKTAGCRRIKFGFETADPSVFTNMGKPGCSIDITRSGVELAHSLGIAVHLHTIVGWSNDSCETAPMLIKYLKQLAPERIGLSVLTPYPGTRFYDQAVNSGLIEITDWFSYTGYEPVMRTKHLSCNEVSQLYNTVMQEWDEPVMAEKIVGRMRMAASKAYALFKA